MTVQAQVRYSGTKMLLEGRVAELEEENEGLKRELERLREEVQRGKEEEELGGDEEVGASGDDRPYTAEDWHHMQLDTDWRSIY
jgi:predicted RNase H-like nuclease (RuvC/YqgF family)